MNYGILGNYGIEKFLKDTKINQCTCSFTSIFLVICMKNKYLTHKQNIHQYKFAKRKTMAKYHNRQNEKTSWFKYFDVRSKYKLSKGL